MRIPTGILKIGKEILRHLLKRPVVGICAVARTDDGRVLLIRRRDSGLWALPGGTVEWGETLAQTMPRELWEEAGVRDAQPGWLMGVYSRPDRDPRFHAVTVVVGARIREPLLGPTNAMEVMDAKLFHLADVPEEMSHGTKDMLDNALAGSVVWE